MSRTTGNSQSRFADDLKERGLWTPKLQQLEDRAHDSLDDPNVEVRRKALDELRVEVVKVRREHGLDAQIR